MSDSKNLRVTFKRLLFGTYSFAENIARLILEILPQPIRIIAFKVALRQFGKNSMIDYQTYLRYPWKIRIGSDVWINRGCELYGAMMSKDGFITIGNNCALGPRVRILSASHDYRYLELPDTAANVTIEDFVWVGAGATILPGVVLGKGAVVAAASVVTKDVAPFTVVGGNPARFIKNREVKHGSPLQ